MITRSHDPMILWSSEIGDCASFAIFSVHVEHVRHVYRTLGAMGAPGTSHWAQNRISIDLEAILDSQNGGFSAITSQNSHLFSSA